MPMNEPAVSGAVQGKEASDSNAKAPVVVDNCVHPYNFVKIHPLQCHFYH